MKYLTLIILLAGAAGTHGQMKDSPEVKDGEGPYPQLIIRGPMLIDGTGAPPVGPVDIVVRYNRIVSIVSLGLPTPGLDSDSRRPKLEEGGKEVNAEGMYILPGFVDMHGHMGGGQAPIGEYVFKLWMAHGITTIRDPGNGSEWAFTHREKSMRNVITAPRIKAYSTFGSGGMRIIEDYNQASTWVNESFNSGSPTYTVFGARGEQSIKSKQQAQQWLSANYQKGQSGKSFTVFGPGGRTPISTAEQAKWWVKHNYNRGADGIKFFGAAPDIMDAALRENKSLGLRSACHHAQLGVARWNVMNSARSGLTTMEHWYGLPEAMLESSTLQNYPLGYNYSDEQNRFEEAGKLWKQAAAPYSTKWNAVMDSLLALDFTLDPTFDTYEASRDLHRARRQEWHETYTLPQLWAFYQPSRVAHGSYWFNWGTEQEVAWKENFRLWMIFVNEYKNRGGRVTAGSDNAYIFQLYGFGYIRELELLREAGFHPLEVVRSATLYGAQALGMDKDIGSIEVGKLADFVIIDQNPLQNLQVLYGVGAIRLTDDNKVVRVGGVKYTVKDGIIYDAKKLLADVKKIVDEEKTKSGFVLKQPGVD